ncbi:hypothetical protein GC194_04205 [bacterium]|nr:hypothetical protein [bacterium]
MNTTLEYFVSKTKTKFLLATCSLICLIGLLVIFGLDEWTITFFEIPVNHTFLGSSLIIIFSTFIVLLIRNLNKKSPAIVITDKSIIDNSSMTSIGEIQIDDITELKTLNVSGQSLILIVVKNPDTYLNRIPNGWKKKVLENNFRTNGTPIVISSSGLNCSSRELYNAINERIKK